MFYVAESHVSYYEINFCVLFRVVFIYNLLNVYKLKKKLARPVQLTTRHKNWTFLFSYFYSVPIIVFSHCCYTISYVYNL